MSKAESLEPPIDSSEPPTEQDLLRDRFFSYIFHELRTPLTVIHSYAQILQIKLPNSPEYASQRRITEQMVGQGDEMVEMIEELLEASRIPLGRLNLDLVGYDFAELLEGLLEHLKPAYRELLTWETLSGPIPVLAEGPRLERALAATINFACQANDAQPLHFWLQRNNQGHQLQIFIPTPHWQPTEAEAAELFDLYRPVREDNSVRNILRAGKLDISLFVARGLIEGHLGSLVFDHALPGFVVSLPLVA